MKNEIISELSNVDRLYEEVNENQVTITNKVIVALKEYVTLTNPTAQICEVLLKSLIRVIIGEFKKDSPKTVLYGAEQIKNEAEFNEFLCSLTPKKDCCKIIALIEIVKKELNN